MKKAIKNFLSFISIVYLGTFLGCANHEVKVTKKEDILTSSSQKNVKKSKEKSIKQLSLQDKERLFEKYIGYALMYISHEDLDSALEYIKEAEKYKTKDIPEFYELRGSVYEGLGNETKAFKDYYKAMILYFNKGNYQKALEMVNSLESIKFGDPELLRWEKKIKLKLYERRMKELEELNKTSNKKALAQ